MKRTTAVALSCAAALALPTAARAQETPTAATPDAAAPLPALAYDTYFEPFTDNPLYRLHSPEPLTKPEPLFHKYDPLEGLTRPAKVSRITLPGDRAVVTMPIVSAHVGNKVSVPVMVANVPALTGIRVVLDYDRPNLLATGGTGAGIPTEDVDVNMSPVADSVQGCPDCMIALNALITPWHREGAVMYLQFTAERPGAWPLSAGYVEVSDNKYNLLPTIFHDGLIRVTP
jgi:hypothetical protein